MNVEVYPCRCCNTPINPIYAYLTRKGIKYRVNYDKKFCDLSCAKFYADHGYRKARYVDEPVERRRATI